MSKREPEVLLEDIRSAIGKIQRYISGHDQASFIKDDKTTDAVVRNLEIIGEAAKQLSSEFKIRHSTIPWPQISGLRNRIVHDYAGVDLPLVWAIVTKSIPELGKDLTYLK